LYYCRAGQAKARANSQG